MPDRDTSQIAALNAAGYQARAEAAERLREIKENLADGLSAANGRLTERAEAAEQALMDANRWTGRVSGPELHRLYGHTASFESCADSMCNFAHKALVAIGDRAALALREETT